MKSAIFLPEAEQEMYEAAKFYESQAPGLGVEFISEIERAIQAVQEAPTRWPIIEGTLRRRLLRRFPFSLLYQIEAANIVIIAVSHVHRKPYYWKKRLEKES